MLFSLTNPEIAILMMGVFLFAVLLGFPIAFTLLAMGVGFGYYKLNLLSVFDAADSANKVSS